MGLREGSLILKHFQYFGGIVIAIFEGIVEGEIRHLGGEYLDLPRCVENNIFGMKSEMGNVVPGEMRHSEYAAAQNGPDLLVVEASILFLAVVYLVLQAVILERVQLDEFMLLRAQVAGSYHKVLDGAHVVLVRGHDLGLGIRHEFHHLILRWERILDCHKLLIGEGV